MSTAIPAAIPAAIAQASDEILSTTQLKHRKDKNLAEINARLEATRGDRLLAAFPAARMCRRLVVGHDGGG